MTMIASQITSLTIVYSTAYSGSSASLAFVRGIHRELQMASYAENVSIWWRHHADCKVWHISVPSFSNHKLEIAERLTAVNICSYTHDKCTNRSYIATGEYEILMCCLVWFVLPPMKVSNTIKQASINRYIYHKNMHMILYLLIVFFCVFILKYIARDLTGYGFSQWETRLSLAEHQDHFVCVCVITSSWLLAYSSGSTGWAG